MAKQQYEKLDRAEALYQEGIKSLEQPSHHKIWRALFTCPITTVHQIEQATGPSTINHS
ncbi:hypothetical protein [Alkalihalobacillus sp. 1P02AB]|uniref:hypothetical protein n=1 Tax=Alkalihalobacillus sp. 1P02AB TaxID=3132260 RepID=UPI0039A6C496